MKYPDLVAQLFTIPAGLYGAELHAAVGIAGEAGEVVDAVKKAWAYGKPLDKTNLVEELGDVMFYVQAMANTIGVSMEEITAANVAKLSKRYPTGEFTQHHAAARLDKVGEQ